jgi:hypothetical protein
VDESDRYSLGLTNPSLPHISTESRATTDGIASRLDRSYLFSSIEASHFDVHNRFKPVGDAPPGR